MAVIELVRNNGPQPPQEPRRLLCRWGFHRWQWVKSFHTRVINSKGEELYYEESFKGHECEHCGRRKVNEVNGRAARGVIEQALEWRKEWQRKKIY